MAGKSSGADVAAALALSFEDDPIFRALLLESGQPLAAEPFGDPSEESHRVAGVVGCSDKSNSTAELECMKDIPAEALRDVISNKTFNAFGVPNGGSPMIDNLTLFAPEEYMRRGEAGRFARVVSLQTLH